MEPHHGSGSNTLIDYIAGNDVAYDMHLKTNIIQVDEIQTDHKLIKITAQSTTALRNSAKLCTRNKDI